MAYTVTIDQSAGRGTVRFTESVNGEALVASLLDLYGHALWRRGYDALWDWTSITELLLDVDDLKGLVALDHDLDDIAGPGRDALVARREIDRLMGALHVALSRDSPRSVRLFHTTAAAAAWLDTPTLSAQALVPPRDKAA